MQLTDARQQRRRSSLPLFVVEGPGRPAATTAADMCPARLLASERIAGELGLRARSRQDLRIVKAGQQHTNF